MVERNKYARVVGRVVMGVAAGAAVSVILAGAAAARAQTLPGRTGEVSQPDVAGKLALIRSAAKDAGWSGVDPGTSDQDWANTGFSNAFSNSSPS